MKTLKLLEQIILNSTKNSAHPLKSGKEEDFFITTDLNLAKKLEKEHYFFCYVFKDKDTEDYLKIGQATKTLRIEDHDGIYPSRGYRSSTLSLSMLMDSQIHERLLKDGVKIDCYKQVFQNDDVKTRTQADNLYLKICSEKFINGKTFKEWVCEHCERYIICVKPIPGIQNKIVQNMIEGNLQYNLNPKYEGHSAHRK